MLKKGKERGDVTITTNRSYPMVNVYISMANYIFMGKLVIHGHSLYYSYFDITRGYS